MMNCPIYESLGLPQSMVESHWPDKCKNLHSFPQETQFSSTGRDEGNTSTARGQGRQELPGWQGIGQSSDN